MPSCSCQRERTEGRGTCPPSRVDTVGRERSSLWRSNNATMRVCLCSLHYNLVVVSYIKEEKSRRAILHPCSLASLSVCGGGGELIGGGGEEEVGLFSRGLVTLVVVSTVEMEKKGDHDVPLYGRLLPCTLTTVAI